MAFLLSEGGINSCKKDCSILSYFAFHSEELLKNLEIYLTLLSDFGLLCRWRQNLFLGTKLPFPAPYFRLKFQSKRKIFPRIFIDLAKKMES